MFTLSMVEEDGKEEIYLGKVIKIKNDSRADFLGGGGGARAGYYTSSFKFQNSVHVLI